MRAYKNQYGWSTVAKGKDFDGSELKKYIPVYFYQCEPDGEQVDFKPIDMFFGAYKTKDGRVEEKLIVKQWSKIVVAGKPAVSDEELPF